MRLADIDEDANVSICGAEFVYGILSGLSVAELASIFYFDQIA